MVNFLLRVVILTALAATLAAASGNLVPEGSFTRAADGGPNGWQSAKPELEWMHSRFAVRDGQGGAYVSVSETPAMIEVVKPVDPSWKRLELAVDVRGADVVPGGDPWEVPYFELSFRDAAGKELDDWRRAQWLSAVPTDWRREKRVYDVPAGASTMRCLLGYKASSGRVEFRNLTLTPASR